MAILNKSEMRNPFEKKDVPLLSEDLRRTISVDDKKIDGYEGEPKLMAPYGKPKKKKKRK